MRQEFERCFMALVEDSKLLQRVSFDNLTDKSKQKQKM